MSKTIIKFELNGKLFFINQTESGKLSYLIKNGDAFVKEISSEDKAIIVEVISSLAVNTKNAIDLGIRKIGQKLFRIFYDESTGLYFWNQMINGKAVEATDEDNCLLNFNYNHIQSVLYNDEQGDQEQGFIKDDIDAPKRRIFQD